MYGDQNVRQRWGEAQGALLECLVRCSVGDREPWKVLEQRRDLSRGRLLGGCLEGKSGHLIGAEFYQGVS